MNSSSHQSQNWLGFSLSNNPNLTHSQSSHLSLYQDDHATDLSIFTGGGPKLENFLGGGSTTSGSTPSPQPSFHFSTHHQSPTSFVEETTEICDSDLKTIAASFLRGFTSTDQNQIVEPRNQVQVQQQHHQQQQQQIQNHQLRVPQLQTETTTPPKKAIDTFGQRTSIYRGVTRHRWTGRYEAHLWDNSCRREGQSRKGRQVYLGGYDKEEKAARAYDLAALKYWGPTTTTNFPVLEYEKELENMKNMTRQEFVASLRRKSSGFSRGASIYRGVTRHHQHGRWQARIGRVAGNKDLYLGTFSTQEEAAEAYDIAAIKFRGLNAVTNFDISRYDVKSIANSNLPIGGMSGSKSKTTSDSATSDSRSVDGGSRSTEELDHHSSPASSTTTTTYISHSNNNNSSTLNFALPIKQDPSASDQYWSSILGYNLSPTLYQQSSTSVPIIFQSNPNNIIPAVAAADPRSSINEQSEIGLFGGVYVNQQQCNEVGNTSGSNSNHVQYNSTATMTTTAMTTPPIALNSGINMEIGQSMRGFQSHHAKPSLFQTPIFGIE